MVSCGQYDPAPTNALVGENLFWVFIWMKPNSAPIGVLVDFEEKPRFIFFHVFFPPLCSSCSSSSLFFSFFPCNKFFELLFFSIHFVMELIGVFLVLRGAREPPSPLFCHCRPSSIIIPLLQASTIFYVSLILRHFFI